MRFSLLFFQERKGTETTQFDVNKNEEASDLGTFNNYEIKK